MGISQMATNGNAMFYIFYRRFLLSNVLPNPYFFKFPEVKNKKQNCVEVVKEPGKRRGGGGGTC